MRTNKNVQSLEKLLGICTGLGENYRPGNQKLQVEAMTTLLSQAQTIVSKMNVAQTAYENATNHREVEFKTLASFSTRLLGALIASDALPQTVDDARAMTRKLAGHRLGDRSAVPSATNAAVNTSPAEPAAAKRRARGLDYNSTVGHFEKLIETIAAEPNYQPLEADLQVAALRERLFSLRDANSKVIQVAEMFRKVRNQRDELLYAQTNSVYHVAKLAKQYVKSVYGFKNDNHRTVSKLPFTHKKQ